MNILTKINVIIICLIRNEKIDERTVQYYLLFSSIHSPFCFVVAHAHTPTHSRTSTHMFLYDLIETMIPIEIENHQPGYTIEIKTKQNKTDTKKKKKKIKERRKFAVMM